MTRIPYDSNLDKQYKEIFGRLEEFISPNINKDSKVIVNGNLYVIGKVSGIVEFKSNMNKLYASSIDGCFVKICSVEKQFNETIENSLISLVNNQITEEKFMDRREKIHGKSNCSYIW